jgi:hypothetical protein
MSRVLEFMFILKRTSKSHCNYLLLANEHNVTYFLRDKPPPFQQACFLLHFTVLSYFLIE